MLNQPGFFDLMDRANKLTKLGDPLVSLNRNINWEAFRSDLNTLRQKDRKSSAGAKAFDVILMFKILVLQQLNCKIWSRCLHNQNIFTQIYVVVFCGFGSKYSSNFS